MRKRFTLPPTGSVWTRNWQGENTKTSEYISRSPIPPLRYSQASFTLGTGESNTAEALTPSLSLAKALSRLARSRQNRSRIWSRLS